MPMRIDVLTCEDPSCGGAVFRGSPPDDATTYGAPSGSPREIC